MKRKTNVKSLKQQLNEGLGALSGVVVRHIIDAEQRLTAKIDNLAYSKAKCDPKPFRIGKCTVTNTVAGKCTVFNARIIDVDMWDNGKQCCIVLIEEGYRKGCIMKFYANGKCPYEDRLELTQS